MPALSGEPWRGQARLKITNATGSRTFVVAVTPGSVPAEGDLSDWERDALGSFTLRAWTFTEGTAPPASGDSWTLRVYDAATGGSLQTRTDIPISVFSTGGTNCSTLQMGSNWLNGGSATGRCGSVEVYFEIVEEGGAGGANSYTANTRSGITAGGVGMTADWARGYVRSPFVAKTITVSNVGYGGAEPSYMAYPDTSYVEVTSDHAHSAFTTMGTLRWRRTAGGTQDWSESDGAENPWRFEEKMDDTFQPVLYDLRLELESQSFGGDLCYVWAASGHAGSPTRVDDRNLDWPARVLVDNRLQCVHLMQHNDGAFGSPPLSKHDSDGQRSTSDLTFLATRVQNMRGELQNGLTVRQDLQDIGGLTAVKTNTSSTATRGGEAGWCDLLVWDSALPGGQWTKVATVTSPADADGLTLVDATDLLALSAPNPKLALQAAIHDESASHMTKDSPLRLAAWGTEDGVRTSLDSCEARVGRVLSDGTVEYLNASNVWDVLSVGETMYGHTMTVASGDANTREVVLSPPAGGWGLYDLAVLLEGFINGLRVRARLDVLVTSTGSSHSGSSFDGVAFALHDVISFQ